MSSVLIVTNEQDLAADLVVLELQRRDVDVLRCNTERLPRWQATCTPGQSWRLKDDLGRLATSDQVQGVWWRRPEPPALPPPLASSEQERAFTAQWQALLESLASVPGPRWISPPAAVRAAEDKAAQLSLAANLGFNVPNTVWTNEASSINHKSPTVVKPVTAAAWSDEGGAAFVFAQLVDFQELPPPEELTLMPASFQQPIWPKRDIRVTVVGDRVLAAAIDHPSKAELDWRLDPDRPWRAYTLTKEDSDRCRELVATLGLRFGGIDLAVDDSGTVWFFEINPNGEWGWLTQGADLPIVDALCDALTLQARDGA
jgi:hypothetical protein